MSVGYLAKCGRKRRHPDQDAAEQHRRELVARGVWTWRKSNTYDCNQCGCWHAGSTGATNRGTSGGRKRARKDRRKGRTGERLWTT